MENSSILRTLPTTTAPKAANQIFVTLVVAYAGVALLAIFLRWLSPRHYAREPLVIPHPVPYFGHAIGMLRHGLKYFEIISARYPLPIYTLNLLSTKLYVITDPDLIVAAQRNTRSLSFNPFITAVFKRMIGLDEDGMAKISHNMDCEAGNWGYMKEMHSVEYASLAPGPGLDEMNVRVLSRLADSLDLIGEKGETVDLYHWIKHLFTRTSTAAVFGPGNPFDLEPELVDVFWTFEDNVKMLMLDFFPWITCPKGARARQIMIEAFERYFNSGAWKDASEVVKLRWEVAQKYGLTTSHAARLEVGMLFGILVNVVPTTFWLLLHILSTPSLLDTIRLELSSSISEPFSLLNINILDLHTKCSLLTSTYHETLRHIAYNSSGRSVLSDTYLSSPQTDHPPILLKKSSILQIPGSVLHANPALWGPDVKAFNPCRFMAKDGDPVRAVGAAYRPFGGGATLCPGRHFAFVEVAAVVAAIVGGFEVEPEVEGEAWRLPRKDGRRLPLSVLKPVGDVRIRIRRRAG